MDVVTYALLKKQVVTLVTNYLNSQAGQQMVRSAIEEITGEIVTADELETALTNVLTTEP